MTSSKLSMPGNRGGRFPLDGTGSEVDWEYHKPLVAGRPKAEGEEGCHVLRRQSESAIASSGFFVVAGLAKRPWSAP